MPTTTTLLPAIINAVPVSNKILFPTLQAPVERDEPHLERQSFRRPLSKQMHHADCLIHELYQYSHCHDCLMLSRFALSTLTCLYFNLLNQKCISNLLLVANKEKFILKELAINSYYITFKY